MKYANIPMRHVGPIKINSLEFTGEVSVPMATLETPLWPSTNRGARISRLTSGIDAVLVDEGMTRSIVVEFPTAAKAYAFTSDLTLRRADIEKVIAENSRFAKLKDLHFEIVGKLVYLRIKIDSGQASGHNMVTASCERLLNWLQKQYSEIGYISLSANICTDKKVSAINGILGRGKYVVAEIIVPRDICEKELKATPEKIVDLHIKKNLIGSTLAGSIRSANAHFANMLLAVYLATGQDCANIIEGSQGIVHAEICKGDLYFSVTLPNLIVGTIGNGKDADFAKQNLEKMDCVANSRKLAIIIAASVLCGELSLLAALTNQGELMRTHLTMERVKQHDSSSCTS